MSTIATDSVRRMTGSTAMRLRVLMGRPGRPMERTWRQTCGTCQTASSEGRTTPALSSRCTSRSRMVASGPSGIPALEDKIVQRATVEVLNAIYEGACRGFSYGFRPGRSPHDALDAVTVGIEKRNVNWVLDADIRGFFDAIDHAWLVKFIEHRIGDQRVVRHMQKWLHAGVLEEGQWHAQEEGTPQGGSVSPLAANIYLHYVLDLWADRWRRQYARGDVIIVRYADDFIVG